MKQNSRYGGEQIIAVCRPTFLSALPAFLSVAIIALILAIGSVLFAVLVAVVGFAIVGILTFLSCISAKYTFSNLRITTQTGLLSIRTTEVHIPDIRGISVRKPLLGRILGYSSADIGTAATASAEIRIMSVRGLDAIIAQIDDLRNQQDPKSTANAAPSNKSSIVYDAKTHQYVKV